MLLLLAAILHVVIVSVDSSTDIQHAAAAEFILLAKTKMYTYVYITNGFYFISIFLTYLGTFKL